MVFIAFLVILNYGHLLFLIYRHERYGEKDWHIYVQTRYILLKLLYGGDSAEKLAKDIEDNWWEHHGRYRSWAVMCVAGGILLLVWEIM